MLMAVPTILYDTHIEIPNSYHTKSTTDPEGGESLMWKIAEALDAKGLKSFNGKQVPPGNNESSQCIQ